MKAFKITVFSSLLFIFISLVLLVSGCASRQTPTCIPITKIEYVEVKTPVIYTLKRPSRPKLDKSQAIPVYVKELTTYAETLEIIIDGTKK